MNAVEDEVNDGVELAKSTESPLNELNRGAVFDIVSGFISESNATSERSWLTESTPRACFAAGD